MDEPYLTNFDDCVDDVLSTIISRRTASRFAIFGHSMGGSLAFEAARKLQTLSGSELCHLFISACRVPSTGPMVCDEFAATSADFLEHVVSLGGMDGQLLDDPSLLDFFMTIIRADFLMYSTYSCLPLERPLDVDFSVLNGRSDIAALELSDSWMSLTSRECWFRSFQGDHFYIRECGRECASYINSRLVWPDCALADDR